MGTVIGFIWFGHGIPAIGLPSLSDILTGPYCAVPASERVNWATAMGANCSPPARSRPWNCNSSRP